jgi:DNA-directed RNA polymerase alpha subunit
VTKQRVNDILKKAQARLFHPHQLMDYAAYPYKDYKAERDRREKLEAIVNDLSKAVGEKSEYVGNTGEKTPIEDLQLSVRSYNCLRIAKLYYAEDVAKLSAARLRRIRNLGQKSIDEIVNKLNANGFSLKSEEVEGNDGT